MSYEEKELSFSLLVDRANQQIYTYLQSLPERNGNVQRAATDVMFDLTNDKRQLHDAISRIESPSAYASSSPSKHQEQRHTATTMQEQPAQPAVTHMLQEFLQQYGGISSAATTQPLETPNANDGADATNTAAPANRSVKTLGL